MKMKSVEGKEGECAIKVLKKDEKESRVGKKKMRKKKLQTSYFKSPPYLKHSEVYED
jgi:hypothetical protein